MTTLYDSTEALDIPPSAEAVAGYVDGSYVWSDVDWARFPGVAHVEITVTGKPGVKVADVESGDLTPMSGVSWAKAEIAAGRRPTLYFSLSVQGQIESEMHNQGVDSGAIDFWTADWTGQAHVTPQAAATQYADPSTSGGHYDLTLVGDANWLPTPAPPAPAPAPQPGGIEVNVSQLAQGSSGNQVKMVQGVVAVTTDGDFGPVTEAAVKQYQSEHGLSVDGVVGTQTWTEMAK